MENLIAKAATLTEALPYIKAFAGATVVVKYGGAAMVDEGLQGSFARDMVLLKFIGLHPVVVHGGGPQIGGMMKRLGKEPAFVGGLRVTDRPTMEIVEMVLSGEVNRKIVSLINGAGGKGIGLSGRDGRMLVGKPLDGASGDRVGTIVKVDPSPLALLTREGFIPIVAPVAVDEAGEALNINADEAAAAIAGALSAAKLFFLTDTAGILGPDGATLSHLSSGQAKEMIAAGTIAGGMIPKVGSALAAVESGVAKVHVVDGRLKHAVLLEIFTTRGVGTEIVAG